MTRTIKAICVLVGMFCVLNSFFPAGKNNVQGNVSAEDNEIRAVWAATVFSLDYPSSATANVASLRSDADRILNEVSALGYNTLFFQVRPSCDAFYKSEIFPWSAYLTGERGLAPSEGFDPLEYMVEKAHSMGIAVHAWINPYRITAGASSAGTVENTFAGLAVKYKDGKLYLNPGEPASAELIANGAAELVRNYAVDGVHMDDYFYPGGDFPDADTFARYGGGFSNIDDWRRNNVTEMIKKVRAAIKSVRGDAVFSVSPCGIWANKSSNPAGSDTNGKQAYYDYYADTRMWAKENLVDWIVPQVYWNIGYSAADFEKVVKWWDGELKNSKTKLIIGQAAYKAADETNPTSAWYGGNGINELENQAALLRECENVDGYAHYRLGSITKSTALKDTVAALNDNSVFGFSDVAGYEWAEEAVKNLCNGKVVSGQGDGTFGFARNVTRADFMIMTVRVMGKKAFFSGNFSDVTPDKYYYKEIGIARALGYTNGTDGTHFEPEIEITREDMAAVVYRILLKEGKIDEGDFSELSAKFSDAYAISDYAKEAVAAMTERGFFNGYENGEFAPKGLATRAETAVFLNRIAESLTGF